MFANRFTAVLDACVLAPALKRNLLLSLAAAEFFRPRWSARILDETERAIATMIASRAIPGRDTTADASRARAAIETAFEDASVTNYEHLESGFKELNDPDDAHVVAAAVMTRASIIVTDNVKDFPADVMALNDLEVKTANEFIADTIDLKPEKAVAAIAAMRARFIRNPISAEELLIRMEANGLALVADALRDHVELL